MIYCVGAKLIVSILALVWVFFQPQPTVLQGFAIGVLPIWAEVLASHFTKFEPSRETRKAWLYIDAAVDAAVFLIAPLTWWTMVGGDNTWLRWGGFIFLSAGFFRIIRFLRSGLDNDGYFQGLPVTYTGYIWPLLAILPGPLQPQFSATILLAFGIAMILPFKFIKASR